MSVALQACLKGSAFFKISDKGLDLSLCQIKQFHKVAHQNHIVSYRFEVDIGQANFLLEATPHGPGRIDITESRIKYNGIVGEVNYNCFFTIIFTPSLFVIDTLYEKLIYYI